MKSLINNFKIVKGHREYYFVIGLGFILLIIVFFIAFIALQNNISTSPTNQYTYSHPTPIQLNQTSIPHTNPMLHNLDIKAASQLVTREEQRTPLSQADIQAKNQILKLLPSGQNYGTVYSSNNIDIEYVQSLDLFDVNILTPNVASAKKEAENWFKKQGMSQQGICNLPLGFYLSPAVANLLQNTNFIFSPLPDGC